MVIGLSTATILIGGLFVAGKLSAHIIKKVSENGLIKMLVVLLMLD